MIANDKSLTKSLRKGSEKSSVGGTLQYVESPEYMHYTNSVKIAITSQKQVLCLN